MTTCYSNPSASRILGEYFDRRRSKLKLTREEVIRLLQRAYGDVPEIEKLTDAWLKRFENGKVVKISRGVIEALFEVLKCDNRERSRVLLQVGWSVLVDEDEELGHCAEIVNHVLYETRKEVYKVLRGLKSRYKSSELSDDDMLELTINALDLVLKKRKNRQK